MAGIEYASASHNSANTTNTHNCSEAVSRSSRSSVSSSAFRSSSQRSSSCPAHQQRNCSSRQRPITLCVLVIMALTLAAMPLCTEGAALSKDLTASRKAAFDRELSLLASAEELIEKAMEDVIETEQSADISASSSSSSSSSSASLSSSDYYEDDGLSPLDVLKHAKRMEMHQKERQGRLRKRHLIHLNNLKTFDGSSHQVEWHNPCNVARENQDIDWSKVPRRGYYYLKKFKDDIRKEYITRNLGLKHIKIDDMDSWRLHREYYAFLPRLKQNSKISLSRWYRNMQTYVAAFAYLGRTQYQWDISKQQYIGDTTKELDQLLTSARLILCELETTINGSHPSKNSNMLKTLTPTEMAEKLQFQTKDMQARNTAGIVEPIVLDLKFTKDSYFKYLATMRKILKHKLSASKNRDIKLDSSENGSPEASSNNVISDTNSINVSSVMRSDSDLSLAESFEMIMKSASSSSSSTPKPQRAHARRNNSSRARKSRKSAELPNV